MQRLRVATPAGTLALGRAPKSAAGPDLRQLILGSEGAFGVITELSVSVRPAPAERIYEGWLMRDFDHGIAAVARLAQDGPAPTVLRLSDEAETAIGLARPDQLGQSGGDGLPGDRRLGGKHRGRAEPARGHDATVARRGRGAGGRRW